MSKRHWKALSGMILALSMASLAVLATRAAGGGGDAEWSTDTFPDFLEGTLDGVDIWHTPGVAKLDRSWWSNVRVNDTSAQSKFSPRVSFALSDTGGLPAPAFLAVWADERTCDHYPDILFARSTDGGQSWSSDVVVSDLCDPDDPPYPNCPVLDSPDLTDRAQDRSLWVVWHQDEVGSDEGNIYYAVSHDMGMTWPITGTVVSDTGTQRTPRIASHDASGRLYTIWEDERDDDGDIYISRRITSVWSAAVKVNDDSSGNEQSTPALAVDAGGDVYAVWEDRRTDAFWPEVYFSRWISGTAWNAGNWSTNARLSDPTMDSAQDPDIVAAPGDVLYAAWTERVPTGPTTYDFQVVVAWSDDKGASWSRSVVDRLQDASASSAFYASPALGVGPQGRVYATWLHSPDSQAATSSVLFSQSPDGGTHWTTPRVLSWPAGTVDVDAVPALASSPRGLVVVAWQDFRDGSSTQIYATGYPSGHYLTSGEYSRIFDAGGPAAWGNITWTASIAPGTGLQLATRVMTSAGAGWTEWVTHATSGAVLTHPSASFIQYRAVFTSTGSNTRVLDEVVISYEQTRLYLPLALRRI